MNKEFIPYEQALEIKELGFDEPCLAYYDYYPSSYLTLKTYTNVGDEVGLPTPLYQQAFRWFREKHELYAWVKYEFEESKITPTYYVISPDYADIPGGAFNTYEEAELTCIVKLIEIVKNK